MNLKDDFIYSILPVEVDSANSIATELSEATTTTYPEEESSGLENEATDNDELPKNHRGKYVRILSNYIEV